MYAGLPQARTCWCTSIRRHARGCMTADPLPVGAVVRAAHRPGVPRTSLQDRYLDHLRKLHRWCGCWSLDINGQPGPAERDAGRLRPPAPHGLHPDARLWVPSWWTSATVDEKNHSPAPDVCSWPRRCALHPGLSTIPVRIVPGVLTCAT
jgi:hypothetical protein